jgi:hypothetical protein
MLVQQRRRRVGCQAGQGQLGQAGGADLPARAVPDGEEQRHRLGGQPPGDEAERSQRRRVRPVRVVDQAQQRALPGAVGQQREGGQRHQEPVGRLPGLGPKRDPQGARLRFG